MSAIKNVIGQLRETGIFVDEEGDLTDAMEAEFDAINVRSQDAKNLLDRLAIDVFNLTQTGELSGSAADAVLCLIREAKTSSAN